MDLKNETAVFCIKTILVNCANSAKYCDELIRSANLTHSSKHFIQGIEKKMLSVERDMCSMISPELAKEIKKEVSDNWETIAVHNIQTMLMAMNDAQKQIVESVCAHVLDGSFRIEEEKTKDNGQA